MEEIEICKAGEEDSPYIKEKLEKYALDAVDVNWRHFFVAKKNDQTVAFGRIIDHGDYFEIASFGVDYYHRKKGIGKRLLAFLIEEAGRWDSKKPIYGVTHRPGFAERVGFKQVDTYPEHLEYKRNHMCRLDRTKIKIMKYNRSGL